MPVILGPDGPSLGGFVCPATTIAADLWKLGQLKAGDKVKFIPVSIEDAVKLEKAQLDSLAKLNDLSFDVAKTIITTPIIKIIHEKKFGVKIVYRPSGDKELLVEYGE